MSKKKMPKSVANDMTQVERIVAHVENGYELLEEDIEYFEEINQAFRIIFSAESPDQARSRLRAFFKFGKGTLINKVIDDTTTVYGNFFVVNKNALRVIQEKRHLAMYHRALRDNNLEVAQKSLVSIERLYLMYTREEESTSTSRKLPRVRRSSDPQVFIDQQKMMNGS